MKRVITAFVLILTFSVCAASAASLTAEQEQTLLNALRNWGSADADVTLEDFFGYRPIKCATPEMLTIRHYVENGSLALQQAHEAFIVRPISAAPYGWPSPSGHFLVHYATEGAHAAYGSQGAGTVPQYVKDVALIMDSLWAFQIDELSYDHPPYDDFYVEGLDERYDVYLVDLKTLDPILSDVYGFTQSEVRLTGTWQYTSYLALDNDYAEIPIYADQPLNAVRVTAAHEFFHAIQFAYDGTEFEVPYPYDEYSNRTHWMEMSAVWMEEQSYDEINDYYLYLPTFFSNADFSLRTSHLTLYPASLFQYAAAIWPLYLSQTFGVGAVRTIWDKCAEIEGPNAFQNAIEDGIVEVSEGTSDFRSALSEFCTWNFFTGSRAIDGFGYEEAEFYAEIPETKTINDTTYDYIETYKNFPVIFNPELRQDGSRFWPDYLAARYIRLEPIRVDSTLTFIFDGVDRRIKNRERDTIDFDWAVRVAKVNEEIGADRIDLDPIIHENHDTLLIKNASIYSDIILVLAPYAITRYDYLHLDVAYKFFIPDSTRAIADITFHNPFPNPWVKSSSNVDVVQFRVDQPGREPIHMDVFTLAGEKVSDHMSKVGDSFIGWDGLNSSGQQVASGMYLVSIRVGSESKVFKVAVIE